MAWSLQQKEAIETTGKNVLVSASAGAGKTAVLVERLRKRCIDDRIPLNKIIALTFTDAAAAEMKKRLSKTLNEYYTKTDDKDYVKQQLVYLQNADITTIDAYCLKIVKKYANVLGLDPAMVMNIADDATLAAIKSEAFDMTLNTMLKENKEAVYDLTQYFSPRSEDVESFKTSIFSIITCANTSNDPDAWYKMAKHRYEPIHTLSELDDMTLSLYYDYLKFKLSSIIHYCDQLLTILSLNDKVKDEYITLVKKKKAAHEECLKNIHFYDTFCLLFKGAIKLEIKNPRNIDASFKNIKEDLEKIEKDLLENLYDSTILIKDHNQLSSFVSYLLDFAKQCGQNIQALKFKYKTIDFEDMEHFAYQILISNNGLIAKQIADAHEEIMVDEFQDTSTLQNDIIECISNGHNTFRVGDVKQSIYRFRKAKPSLMRNMKQDTDNYHVICFPNNFRSKENIVEFNNELYSACMNIEGCLDEYGSEDVAVIGSDKQKDIKDDAIKFYLLEKEKGQAAAVLKAEFIANKIYTMMNEDSKLHYSDFVVLLKSHHDKRYLKDAFEKFNLPYNVDAKDNFYKSDACMMVLSFCKLLISRDDIALLSVLTSFYNVSNDELALLKLNYNNIYKGLVLTNHPFIDDLNELKILYKEKGLLACLNKISTINDFYERKIDNKQKTNFDQLFEIARKYVSTSFSLEQFIDEIEHMDDTDTKEVTSISKDEDVVRAVTIHQSKGLQYNTVFLWSNSLFMPHDTNSVVLCDSDYGIAIKPLEMPYRYSRNSIERIGLEHKVALEELEEYTRLLYVATTRAVDRLYIVDELKESIKDTDISLSTLFKRKGITGTVLASLANNHYMDVEIVSDLSFEYPDIIEDYSIQTIKHLDPYVLNMVNIVSPSKQHSLFPKKLKPVDQFSHGTLIHETLEHIEFRPWSTEELKALQLNDKDIKHLLWFNNTDLFKQLCHMKCYKEYPFIYLKDNKTVVNGTIDLLAMKDNEILCIDYKTNHNTTKEELIDMYQSQLNIYRDCLAKAYPEHHITCMIVALSIEEAFEI